jgi:hypothetical protein
MVFDAIGGLPPSALGVALSPVPRIDPKSSWLTHGG